MVYMCGVIRGREVPAFHRGSGRATAPTPPSRNTARCFVENQTNYIIMEEKQELTKRLVFVYVIVFVLVALLDMIA